QIKLADRAVRRVPAGHDLAVQGLPALEDGVHGAEVDPAEGGGDLGQDDVLEPAGDVTGVFESGDEAHAVFAHVVLSDRRTEGGARVDEHGDDPAVHGADHGRDLVLLGE